MNEKILYSQSWEDPLVLSEALEIDSNDVVLSISSAGDNSLFLLSKNPKKLISIDLNPFQNFILEFKAAGIKTLDHKDFLELIGVLVSNKREELYIKIKNKLSLKCQDYWNENIDLIRKGVIHSGKFENYLSKFRYFVIPLSHSKIDINTLLELDSLDMQREFYEDNWNNLRWRISFKIFFSKIIMKMFGRSSEFFKHNKNKKISQHYLERTFYGLTKIPIKNNYFLHYILLGEYNMKNLPEYLKEENFYKIKDNIDKLKIVTSDLKHYLKKQRSPTFSKFNLSDIFELLSQNEYEGLLRDIMRTSYNKSIICYWNNLVSRNRHSSLNKNIINNKGSSRILFLKDRVFFYSDFIVERINK